ncbi:MAG TPA: low-specificity L-threonine aldolase [Chloroflexota bacterium]|nr:low-specificity L-threonine aldolase [Chloroflexota bacterium]
MIDLRSDTVTQPTPAMREAMYRAEVGDDVYGEDPTVNRLEAMAAERLGKEAALLLLSGTMGNLVGILAQTRNGDEVIVGQHSHIFLNEAGGAATLGGVQLFPIPSHRGRLDPQTVAASIRADNVHFPRTSLVCLENTANRDGGAAVPVAETDAVAAVAHEHGLRLHLDGARLFNAAVALGVPASRLAQEADSVTFCLSKGLGCPVGSILAGSAAYIKEARRWRKMVGGSLRQSGIIAAAGIVALEEMVERLAEDHHNARRLAEGLAELPGLAVDLDAVETNIIMLHVTDPRLDPRQLVAAMAERGVKIGNPYGPRIRLVTHYQVRPSDVDVVLRAARESLHSLGLTAPAAVGV